MTEFKRHDRVRVTKGASAGDSVIGEMGTVVGGPIPATEYVDSIVRVLLDGHDHGGALFFSPDELELIEAANTPKPEPYAVPDEVLNATWIELPGEYAKKADLRQALAAGLPVFEELLRHRLAYELEIAMNKPAPGCACPASPQRSCGWRDGIGHASDIVRGESGRN